MLHIVKIKNFPRIMGGNITDGEVILSGFISRNRYFKGSKNESLLNSGCFLVFTFGPLGGRWSGAGG